MTTMDESKIVGLITGSASVPQDDLSPDGKATIILCAHDVIKGEIENLVTKGFQLFHEFAKERQGHHVQYNCVFPDFVAGARVGLVFTADTALTQGQEKGVVEFARHSALITTKGDLFWLVEQCSNCFSNSHFQSVVDVVSETGIEPLERTQLRHYLQFFPALFPKMITNFLAIAEHAFEMRRQRQERTQIALDKLARINNMIGLVKFV